MSIKQHEYDGAFNLYSKQMISGNTWLRPISQLVNIHIAAIGHRETATSFTISEVGLCQLKEA